MGVSEEHGEDLTMAQPLASFQGTVLYLDAMILAAFVDTVLPWHAACRQLLFRAIDPAKPIRLITAALTLDEAVFVLLQELLSRPPYGITRSRSQYLRAHPEVVRNLMPSVDQAVDGLLAVVSLEPVLPEDITAMRREMIASGILPRDAIHLSVMRRLGITAIASDDDGFDGYPDIALFKP
jgi:predicted nucleic acid-binding protein